MNNSKDGRKDDKKYVGGSNQGKGAVAGLNPSEAKTGLELLGGNAPESGKKGRRTPVF